MSDSNVNQNRQPFHEDMSDSWIITRYADAKEVFQNPETFSSKSAYENKFGAIDVPEQVYRKLDKVLPLDTKQLISLDPPEHGTYRRLISRVFSKSNLDDYGSVIQPIADRLISDLAPNGAVDLYAELILPFSNSAILAAIGFDHDELETINTLANESVLLFVMTLDEVSFEQHANSLIELIYKIRGLVDNRSAVPQNDIVSRLLYENRRTDSPMNENEIVQFLLDIVFAGNDPVQVSLSSFFLQILAKKGRVAGILNEPSTLKNMLHEAIRLSTGLRGIARRTTKKVLLGGTLIPANSNVLVIPGLVNRDEEQYENSLSYNPMRSHVSKHLGYGYSNHYCVGASLAEAEMSILVLSLLKKFPNLSLNLNDPVGFRKDFMVQRMSYLNVKLK